MANSKKSSSGPNYYHVRISPKHENPSSDFTLFMNDIELTGEGKWDQDAQGKLTAGDYLGFIVGPKDKQQVNIFKVKNILTESEREVWWQQKSYTSGNTSKPVSDRKAIVLIKEHELPSTWPWLDMKEKIGLAPKLDSYIPRGTQRVIKASRMPFSNPF